MKSHPTSGLCALLLISAALTGPAFADVKLPAIISDNMVLQQETPAGVWGWAEPGEKVTVKFAGKSAETAAGADGKWNVKLEALTAGATGELTVAGKNTLTVKNVVVGEVWVASGQSNMEFTVNRGKDADEETKAANFPLIRMYTVKKNPATEPADDTVGKWEVCSPETVPTFSAVAYYFARRLYQNLKQPVGIIHSSWGGTPAEYWTPKSMLTRDPAFKSILDSWDQAVANYPQAKAKYEEELAAFKEASKTPPAAGATAPKPPRAPRGGDAFGSPGCLFNCMIAPFIDYTIRGAIWYQGEANARAAELYKKLFPTMIHSWRASWQRPGSAVPLRPVGQFHAAPSRADRHRLGATPRSPARNPGSAPHRHGRGHRHRRIQGHPSQEQTGSRPPPRSLGRSHRLLPRPGILRSAPQRLPVRGQ